MLRPTQADSQAVLFLTDDFRVASVSESAATVLGWTRDDLLGRSAMDVVARPEDQTRVATNGARLRAGHQIVQRLPLVSADGSPSWFTVTTHPLDDSPSLGAGAAAYAVVLEPIDVPMPATPGRLSGLGLRSEVLEHLDDVIRAGSGAGIVLVEFGNLRTVNETLGVEAGDAALDEFARRLHGAALTHERVGRMSGKSFIVVHPAPDSEASVRSRAVEIADALGADLAVAGRRVQPVVRAAVALSREGSTAMTLVRDADVAMSEARDDEYSGVVVFDQAMSNRALERIVLADELRNALEADEFDLHFQPIIALDTRRMVATEALLRWRHPEQGVLAPPSFLSVAEKSRLIRRIGREVLTQACLALNELPPHTLQVGVNVSAVELADDAWLSGVLDVLERAGTDPCCLVLELTETSVLSAKRDIRKDMRQLRSMGIGLFLDDFGTGYSSLSLLYDLPVSGIKLDKSFVTMVSQGDEYGIALTRGIGDLMGRLGLVGVAEGIERPEDAERLLELGWGFGQGYAFGWPTPFDNFSDVHVGSAGPSAH